jgi:hypothetical protein
MSARFRIHSAPSPMTTFLFRAAPSAVPGLQIKAPAELFGGLHGSGAGSRIRIANREAFFVMRGLSEYASQLTSRVWAGWPSVLPLRPSVSFFTTGTPVPSICTYRIGIGSPTITGKSSWTALRVSRCPWAAISAPMASAVRSTDLAVTSRPARTFHLLAAVIERDLLTHQSLHASHAG